MKRIQVFTIAAATSAVVLTGCTYPNGDPNNTGTGALIGAGSGAALGAALGGRNAGAGALVGAAFGALTGALIGNSIDRDQAAQLQASAPVTYVRVQQNQPLAVSDVEALVRAKVSDDVIIAQIQNSHAVYHLSPQDIIDLHTAGVSDRVVNFMIATVNGPPPPPTTVVTSDQPPPVPDETVAAAPGPGWVWIGGEWEWNGVGWVWAGGRWAYPPYPGAIWVHGYWYRGPFGGWRHVGGHWRY
ncbi:MAG TPA: YXWGXW repeat-containing protein [Candidatus Sulfotelmatobacter sp.]|nr:YXWGXW repeat-containing protein [Candidatus Sulfotelmatobacter sp.]